MHKTTVVSVLLIVEIFPVVILQSVWVYKYSIGNTVCLRNGQIECRENVLYW